MDYYNRHHLSSCNYSQILERDKCPPECVRINNYLILPNSKEVIFLHGLFCGNNTSSLDHPRLYECQPHELPSMHYSDQISFK